MKHSPKSISFNFTPSRRVAQQLEQLSQITQIAPEKLVKNTLRSKFAMVASAVGPRSSWFDLEMELPRLHSTEKRAKAVADNYNAHAERMGWPAKRCAYIEPYAEGGKTGRFRIRFARSQAERRALAA
jgi:hypothetical protein